VKEGKWFSYYDNGKLEGKGSYKNGKREGEWVWYHDNGKLYSKGSYKNGEREGKWVHYDYNGIFNEFISGTLKNGMKVSD